MYEITVAVCVYKQKEWLHRCLRSLNSQTLEKSRYEVVVVNDDPDETLDDITDIFKEHMNIRVINNEKNFMLQINRAVEGVAGHFVQAHHVIVFHDGAHLEGAENGDGNVL